MGEQLVNKNEGDDRLARASLDFRLDLAHCPFHQAASETIPVAKNQPEAPTPLVLVKVGSNQVVSVKTCTCCGKTKSLKFFHKNRSKPLGAESACRTCVGKQKRKTRQAGKKKRLSTVSFTSTVVGELGEESVQRFAESYSEIIRDLRYDKKI